MNETTRELLFENVELCISQARGEAARARHSIPEGLDAPIPVLALESIADHLETLLEVASEDGPFLTVDENGHGVVRQGTREDVRLTAELTRLLRHLAKQSSVPLGGWGSGAEGMRTRAELGIDGGGDFSKGSWDRLKSAVGWLFETQDGRGGGVRLRQPLLVLDASSSPGWVELGSELPDASEERRRGRRKSPSSTQPVRFTTTDLIEGPSSESLVSELQARLSERFGCESRHVRSFEIEAVRTEREYSLSYVVHEFGLVDHVDGCERAYGLHVRRKYSSERVWVYPVAGDVQEPEDAVRAMHSEWRGARRTSTEAGRTSETVGGS